MLLAYLEHQPGRGEPIRLRLQCHGPGQALRPDNCQSSAVVCGRARLAEAAEVFRIGGTGSGQFTLSADRKSHGDGSIRYRLSVSVEHLQGHVAEVVAISP